MDNIKVIQYGLGAVGKAITKILDKKKGVEIVGALDVAQGIIGKDLGEAAGIGRQFGVLVTDDADSLFSEISADVVIHTTSPTLLRKSYLEMIKLD